MALTLHTIICSTRPGRVGPTVADWFHSYAAQHGTFDAKLVDLAAFELPVFDEPEHPRLQKYVHEHTKAWSASVSQADAFAFVIPEYNYFPPSSFVNAVSFLSREWAYKPCGFVSYGGAGAGLRSSQTAKLLATSMKLMPIPEGVMVPNPWNSMEDGTFASNELIENAAGTMLDELYKWAGALKTLR